MLGVVKGVYYGQHERVDELNQRIGSRQFPDAPLAPNFDPRPVSTKYACFPCIDGRSPVHEPIITYPAYRVDSVFSPSTDKSPWNGFSKNVDIETRLRNQGFALQHNTQKDYIPSSSSDLYHVTIVSRPENQPYPLLFEKPNYATTAAPLAPDIGGDTFYNHTRTQLRGM